MIGFQNQFILSFSIGPYEDFIEEENLVQFKIIECAGNVLPLFELQFKTDNSTLLAYLNETNPLKIQMGVDEVKFDIEYVIKTKHIEKDSANIFTVNAKGHLNQSSYLLIPKRRPFGNVTSDNNDLSGLEVIYSVASENFAAVESNRSKSLDSMPRVQYGISNKRFIDEIWETLYTPETFIMLGITSAGKFKMVDTKAISSNDPKWNFTFIIKNPKTDIVSQDFNIDDNSGVNNYLFGYIRQREFFDEDDGQAYISTTGNKTMLSMSDYFSREDIWLLNTQMARTDNMYNEYWEARDTNLSNWGLFSSINAQLNFDPDWKEIEVLDLVMIQAPDAGATGNQEEAYSGLAIVNAVSRIFQNRKITTCVSLNREGLNQIK